MALFIRSSFQYMLISFLAIMLVIFLPACLPQLTPLPPLPTSTPSPPTETPTPTTVWFPPTATYTPQPTVIITPTLDLKPQSGALIFQDDFTLPTQWTLGQTSSTSIALGVNALTLALDQPGGYLYSLRQGTDLRDFYLEITSRTSLCKGEDEYGLLLRVTPGLDFYRFSLSCNGQVRLDKYFQGTASSPQPFILSGAVPPGAPGTSQLGVWASGKEMRFFINGEHQFTIQDPSISTGGLGVFIRSAGKNAVTVSFTDLEVYEVSP